MAFEQLENLIGQTSEGVENWAARLDSLDCGLLGVTTELSSAFLTLHRLGGVVVAASFVRTFAAHVDVCRVR